MKDKAHSLINNKEKVIWILGIVCLVLLIVSIFMYLRYSAYLEERNELMQNLEETSGDLEEKNKLLEETSTELNQLNLDYNEVKSKVDSTLDKIENYNSEIEDSMDWLKQNSNIEVIENKISRDIMKNFLEQKCFSCEDPKERDYRIPGETLNPKCYINLGCFNLVNEEFVNYVYIRDEEKDDLKSINGFTVDGGGDCEDYSLFYKAQFNYLLDIAKDSYSDVEIVLDSWESTDSYLDEVYLDYNLDWYVMFAEGIIINEGYQYPIVICGNVFDPYLGDFGGHCIISFTKKELKKISQVGSYLDGSPVFEPQSGEYLGRINEESSSLYLAPTDNPNFINEIITDQDLFLFSEELNNWLSYESFREELYSDKVSINEFKEYHNI